MILFSPSREMFIKHPYYNIKSFRLKVLTQWPHNFKHNNVSKVMKLVATLTSNSWLSVECKGP
jgi:hypothetical protein